MHVPHVYRVCNCAIQQIAMANDQLRTTDPESETRESARCRNDRERVTASVPVTDQNGPKKGGDDE